MHSLFTEYLCVFVVMRWDNLVPCSDSLVSGLLGELLRYCRFCDTCRVNFQDVEIQFFSGFEEGSVSDCGSHSRNSNKARWFPRRYSLGADDD